MAEDPPASDYAQLESSLGYRFLRRELCEAALTHTSWINERVGTARSDNERYEFLGDAVLDLVTSHLLMKRFPDWSEGALSKARAALVNDASLARVADAVSLGRWVFLGKGEEQGGGRAKRSILANALEALVGAIFLDGGFVAAQGVLERLLEPSVAVAELAVEHDFKSRLQELSQARMHLEPRYTVLGQAGPDHEPTFEVAIHLGEKEYGRAQGKSKKDAQQHAAALAIAALADEGKP